MQPAPELSVTQQGGTPSQASVSSPANARGADTHAVTAMLQAWGGGDDSALDALFPIIYGELRQRAGRVLGRERAGHTLQPTALVHEAYLRLVDQKRVRWEGRTQFFAVAARVMRRVLVDHARARLAGKRGGGARHVTLLDASLDAKGAGTAVERDADTVDLLALDDALLRLADFDPRKARLVELRYFAGLSIPESAHALGVSESTVVREWNVARRWLHRELSA